MRSSVLFGAHIVHLRDHYGWSRAQLAASSGLSLDVLEQLEHGEVSPDLATLRQLAFGLGLPLSKLFECFDDPIVCVVFGERVQLLRERRGWSRAQLAEASDLGVDAVEQIERGEVSPELAALKQLARGFGLRLSELFEDPDEAGG